MNSWKVSAMLVLVLYVCCSVTGFLGALIGQDHQKAKDAAEIAALRVAVDNLTGLLAQANGRTVDLSREADPLAQRLSQKLREMDLAEQRANAGPMPLELLSELVSQPTLAFGTGLPVTSWSDDPAWHEFRRSFAEHHEHCMVDGCTEHNVTDAIQHGIAADYCVKAGHYELAVGPGVGQQFFRLCRKHYAELGHGIGYGGGWDKFNLDLEADVRAGRWNSRGKSEWAFRDEAEAMEWVRTRLTAEGFDK